MSTIYEAALASSQWNSMTPERTARIMARDFDDHLDAVRDEFLAVAEHEADAEMAFIDYAEGYEQRFRAWLAARGRTASAMVTGPSNFPTRRNAKAIDSERRRSEELTEWSERERKRALKKLKPARDYAAELAQAEELLDKMKACNAVVRKKWTDERKVAAMVADVGVKEETARKILLPDFAGRPGFPSHQLASLRGKIKRLRALAA